LGDCSRGQSGKHLCVLQGIQDVQGFGACGEGSETCVRSGCECEPFVFCTTIMGGMTLRLLSQHYFYFCDSDRRPRFHRQGGPCSEELGGDCGGGHRGGTHGCHEAG